MASVYDLKPRFQTLLRPFVGRLARAGVSANQVTIAAIIMSVVMGAVIALYPLEHWPLLVMPAALLARMALNAVDGMLAREHQMTSSLGGLLNELGDVISDAALYLPLALVPGISIKWIVFAVILAIIAEMSGVLAVQIGAQRRHDGPMGKSDRAFVFGLLCLLLGLDWLKSPWFNNALMVVVILLMVTIFNRARRALADIS
jgi:CDP-diacylglycerol---glycerol-3-phosphate 3-phosphatidyltransferase